MIRAIIQQVVEGLIKRFTASGRFGETIIDREYFQHYGFTSRPHAGAEGIVVSHGNHFVMVATDDRRYRIPIDEGEAAIYDDLGQKVHLTRSGIVVSSPTKITATAPEVDVTASTKVVFTTPLAHFTGDIRCDGDIYDHNRSMAGDRGIYDTHTHPVSGGTTSAPNQTMGD